MENAIDVSLSLEPFADKVGYWMQLVGFGRHAAAMADQGLAGPLLQVLSVPYPMQEFGFDGKGDALRCLSLTDDNLHGKSSKASAVLAVKAVDPVQVCDWLQRQ